MDTQTFLKFRVTSRKSELQHQSEVTARKIPRIRTESSRKGIRMGLGKIQTGAHKRGLKPQIFRENRGEILPGKSGLFGANWGLFRADRGLFGADRDQFLRTPQPRGKSRNWPERALFGFRFVRGLLGISLEWLPKFDDRLAMLENSMDVRQLLSGPLDRLNAILSLLQPLDRYRTPSAIGSAIGRPYLALSL